MKRSSSSFLLQSFPSIHLRKMSVVLNCLLLLLLSLGSPFAMDDQQCDQILFQRKHVSGLNLQICQTRITKNPFCSEGQVMSQMCPANALFLGVRVLNNSETRKLELNAPLQFYLKDNFNNTYAQIDLDSTTWPNSFYPGDSVFKELLFEPPVESFKSLTLVVDTGPMGIDPPVLTLPIYREMINYPDQTLPAFSPYMTVIDIVQPKRSVQVKPGDVVRLQIQINERVSRPDMVLIITPNFTLEDIRHRYQYNVRIPEQWEPGRPFQVAVVAQWNQWENQRIASESIALEVLDPHAACLDECLKNN